MARRRRIRCWVGVGASVALLLVSGSVHTAVLVVDRTDDDPTASSCGILINEDCSLRGAIIHANGTPEPDTILLQAATYTLTQPQSSPDTPAAGDLDITNPVEIGGVSSTFTVVDANGVDRVFHVDCSGDVTLRDLKIRNGITSGSGGGIYLTGVDTFSLVGCSVTGNQSTSLSITDGGGGIGELYTYGTVLIEDSSISGNAAMHGGGLLNASASLTIRRSTFSGNSASGHGTAVYTCPEATLINSTVSGNSQGPTPTAAVVIVSSGTAAVTASTIVAAPTSHAVASLSDGATTLAGSMVVGTCTTFLPDFGSGTLDSAGGNLESPGNTCNLGFLELRNVPDPMLSPLLPHGGHTMTHLPLPGSPAIDQPIASAGCPDEDQRGVARPQDGNGDLTTICDIGSVEVIWQDEGLVFADDFESGDTSAWSGSTV